MKPEGVINVTACGAWQSVPSTHSLKAQNWSSQFLTSLETSVRLILKIPQQRKKSVQQELHCSVRAALQRDISIAVF